MTVRGAAPTLVKSHLVAAQLLPFVLLAEVVLFGTYYAAVPALLAIGGLIPYRCRACGTPLWDERIMGRRLPVSPSVVERCGACGHPMFGRE